MRDTRTVFPMFPERSWWPLRERFKQSMPASVTSDYLCTVLGVEPKTARNLYPTLKSLGLIDADGLPTDRANRWRVDQEYPLICREMLDELYPASLRNAVPDPSRDFRSAVGWFMREAGVGEPAARRMARFYELLCEATPNPAAHAADPAQSRTPARAASTLAATRSGDRADLRIHLVEAPDHETTSSRAGGQQGRVDVHLHFSPDLSERQIDTIFRSLAEHVLGRS
jgi:hypothetical protein